MTTKTIFRYYGFGIPTLIGTLLMNGCSTPPTKPPEEKIANAELVISRAQDSKAQDFASQELHDAQNNLQKAKNAAQNKNYDQATRLAERALVEAKLAEAKAELEMTRQVTKEIRENVEKLAQQLNQQKLRIKPEENK